MDQTENVLVKVDMMTDYMDKEEMQITVKIDEQDAYLFDEKMVLPIKEETVYEPIKVEQLVVIKPDTVSPGEMDEPINSETWIKTQPHIPPYIVDFEQDVKDIKPEIPEEFTKGQIVFKEEMFKFAIKKDLFESDIKNEQTAEFVDLIDTKAKLSMTLIKEEVLETVWKTEASLDSQKPQNMLVDDSEEFGNVIENDISDSNDQENWPGKLKVCSVKIKKLSEKVLQRIKDNDHVYSIQDKGKTQIKQTHSSPRKTNVSESKAKSKRGKVRTQRTKIKPIKEGTVSVDNANNIKQYYKTKLEPQGHDKVESLKINNMKIKTKLTVTVESEPKDNIRQRNHSCPKCTKSFFDKYTLGRHMLIHKKDKPFKCQQCSKGFTWRDSLEAHVSFEHKGERPTKCPDCGKCFALHTNMVLHRMIHTGEKPHRCDECGQSFVQLGNLRKHQLIHAKIKAHECKHCGKCFTRLSHLKNHELTHTGLKPFKCPDCDKTYARADVLKIHRLTHSGKKSYVCKVCGKAFLHVGSFRHHELVHSGAKPHSCTYCDSCFSTLGELKVHMRTHTGQKPYQCEVCGKSCSQLSNLKSHKLTHTGIKDHKCAICDKEFTHSTTLKIHMFTHTQDVKPHICGICGKDFIGSQGLKFHMLTHTGEKPYACSECGRSFALMKALRTHILTHNGQKPHRCKHCGRGFSQLGNCKNHEKLHEKDKQKN